MCQRECFAHVLLWCNDLCLVWVVAKLLSYATHGHRSVIRAAVSNWVPNKSANALWDHIRHEVEFFTKSEATQEGTLKQLASTFWNAAFGQLGHLHVEVVWIERLNERKNVQEYCLSIWIEYDLLLSDQKFRINEIFVYCCCLRIFWC